MADLAEEHRWRDTFVNAEFSIAMVAAARFVAIKSVPYSHLFELFETYDLNERKTVDIVFADSAIVVHFSINALPGKSLEEGLFFDKLAASFLSLFGSWLRHLTKFLTHIVEFAGQNAQLLALILMVAIFLCCILFLAVQQWRRRKTHDKALITQEMTVNDDHGVDQASQGDTPSNGSMKTGDVGGKKEVTKEFKATGSSLPCKKEMMQRIPMGPKHGGRFSPYAPPTQAQTFAPPPRTSGLPPSQTPFSAGNGP